MDDMVLMQSTNFGEDRQYYVHRSCKEGLSGAFCEVTTTYKYKLPDGELCKVCSKPLIERPNG